MRASTISRVRTVAGVLEAARVPVMAAWLAAGTLLVTACGGGDGGGGGTGPTGTATISADTVTTGPSERATLEIALLSDRVSAGFQVDVLYDPGVIPLVQNVTPAGRAADVGTLVFQNVEPGRTRILLFDDDGQPSLASGQGPIAMLSWQTAPGAAAGTYALTLAEGLVVNGDGDEFELTLQPGSVTVLRP